MSKAIIYVVNNSTQDIVDGGIINLGSIIRRFGTSITLSGNGVQINDTGYYTIDSSITLSSATAGDITVTMYNNGIAIPGAVATETVATADDVVNLSINAIIRETGCCYYNNGPASLTFVISGGDVTVTNVATTVVKL